MHFLDILETFTLFCQYTALFTSAYTLNTENIIPIEGYTQITKGLNDPMCVVLNNIFDKDANNINRFLGFLSYYSYVIGNYKVEGLDYVLKNLNYTGEIQKINLKYLFDTTSILPSIYEYLYFKNDVNLDLFVSKTFNTLKIFLTESSFLKNNQVFFVSNDYSSFIKYYNDLHLVFFNTQLFFNAFGNFPEIAQYLSKEINFTTFFGLNYDNIFLSTYLVIIFLLINLSFKITAAPFHF